MFPRPAHQQFCQPRCDIANWQYHPVGAGAHGCPGYPYKILTTCRVCGQFIGYIDEKVKAESDRKARERAAKKAVGAVEVDPELFGVGI